MTQEQITRTIAMLSCLDVDSIEKAFVDSIEKEFIVVSPDVSPEEIAFLRKTYPNADELREFYLKWLELFMKTGAYTEKEIKKHFNIVL